MENLILIVFGLLGILLHVLMKFQDVVTKEGKNGRKFKERATAAWSKYDLLGNLVYAGIAVIVVVLFVYLAPATKTSILLVGYAADSAFKNLSNLNQ